MTIKALDHQQETKTVLQEKTEPPKPWKVIVHHNPPKIVLCTACVLRDVFSMNNWEAARHAIDAYKRGVDVVFEAPKDTAETKAGEANESAQMRAQTCNPALRHIKFTAELK